MKNKLLFLLGLILLLAPAAYASVNVLTGNLSYRQGLFATQGGALPLQVDLRYNSLDQVAGELGVGWSHGFEIYLHENSDGTLVLAGGLTKHFYFSDGSGGYVTRIGDFSTLTANADGTYTISFHSGTVYQFNSDKKLTSKTDRFGNSQTFSYATSQLTITDSAGRSAIVSYNDDGKVSAISDPAMSSYNFTYTSSGLLETITYPAPTTTASAPVWTYSYNTDGLLSYIKDPEGHIRKYEYTDGKVSRTVAPEGVTDISGGETSDSSSYSVTYSYEASAALPVTGTVVTTDSTQTIVTREDGGQWHYFSNASEGVLSGKIDPAGHLSEYQFYASSSTYYGQRQATLTPLEVKDGSVIYRLTNYLSYDANGNPLEVTSQTRTITYDAAGLATATIDGDIFRHLSYSYGTYNRPTSITDEITGITTTISYSDTADGGEQVVISAPKINSSDASAPQTTLTYRSDGQLASVTDALGRTISYTYDTAGLLASVTDPDNLVSTFSDYNSLGLATTLTLTGSEGTSRSTSLQYDALARLIEITQGSASDIITGFSYDGLGNQIGVTDAEDNLTDFDYDSKGQVTRIGQTLDADSASPKAIDTNLQYGGSGCSSCSGGSDKLTALVDAKGQATQFAYDLLGNLVQQTDAELNSLSYDYSADGRILNAYVGPQESQTLLLSYSYTDDGKLLSQTDASGTLLASYSYNSKQQLATANTPGSSLTFSYYDNGWLKSVDNGSYTVNYEYDALSRRELVTVSDGSTTLHSIDYQYDDTSKELTAIVSDKAGTFGFSYDEFGRRKILSYPNGVSAAYSFTSDMDRLTGINYTGDSGDLLSIGYPEHDKVGNRMQRTEDSNTTSYTYDDLYRVTSATSSSGSENFTYDEVGNRESGPTVKDTADVAYDHNATNQMLLGRKYSYAYDARGNQEYRYLTSDKSAYWHYSWNAKNQLTGAKLVNSGTTLRTLSFAYDAFGRRVKKSVTIDSTTTTTSYVYDGEDIILQLTSGTTTHYVHGPGIDEPLAMVTDGNTYYYHADGLGSIVAITNASQTVVQRYSYDTFGMVSASDATFANSYAFTGREWDKELGLYYYRARYYDPMDGRFIAKDPIGFAGGDVNVYGYVGNRPVNRFDPYGLWDIFLFGEVDFVPFLGKTWAAGISYDTEDFCNDSGYFTSEGRAVGFSFGAAFGGGINFYEISGNTYDIDFNLLRQSWTLSFDPSQPYKALFGIKIPRFSGIAWTFGPGIGHSFSNNNTTIYPFINIDQDSIDLANGTYIAP